MKPKPYPKYKDSGIQWIGEIPEGWEVRRIRFNCQVNPTEKKYVIDKKQKVSFLPMGKVSENGEFDYESIADYNDVSSGYTYFQNKDVIVAKITPCFENGKGALVDNLLNGFGFGTTEFHVLRPNKEVEPKYVYYFTFSNLFRVVGEAFMQGAAGQKRISTEFVKDFPMPTPPLPDQTTIANFLDKKTAKIDAMIEKDKRLIELLKERRTALINHAVTKGLDQNAKFKDSGVEWIGEIPKGWEVRKLKYLVEDLSGNGFPEEEQGKDAGDIPFYKVSDINGSEKFVEKANNFVSKKTIEDYKWNVIPEYSLIAPKIGEALKKNHRKITKVKCIIDNNCIAFKTFDIDYNYNYYLFNLINFEWFVNPGAVPSLSVEKLRSLITPLPPLPDQTAIANFLDKATAKIDKTIQKIENKINLLEEYKKSLIHHVVTGKIDVRGIEA